MKTIRQLLDGKGRDIWFLAPEAPVFDAIKMMAEKGVGALVVLEDDKLVGILSERDYARKVILKGKASKETPVRDIMTRDVLCARPDQTVEQAMALMTNKHVRHLPVVIDDKVDGIVSIGDLVKAIIDQQQFIIEQLEHYIRS